MQCKEIYDLIYLHLLTDDASEKSGWFERWKNVTEGHFSRWCKGGDQRPRKKRREHMSSSTSSLHTHISTAVHIVDPELLTTITHLYDAECTTMHSQQFVSLRCLLVAPRWGTDAWKQNFLVRVPDPLAQGNFCHFFVPKILGNLAALFEKSGKICQAMIAIWAMCGHADGVNGE